MSDLPVLTRMDQLEPYDGETVVIEGVYTKRLSQRKMNDPALYFFGFVDIAVEGGRVQLGSFRREEDEVAAFTDQRVRVSGKLKLDRGAVPEYVARPDPTPTLVQPADLRAAP